MGSALKDRIKLGGETCVSYAKKKQIRYYNVDGLLTSIGKHRIDGIVDYIVGSVFSTLSYYKVKPEIQYRMARHFKEALSLPMEQVDHQGTFFAFAGTFQGISVFSASNDSAEAWARIQRIVKHFKNINLDSFSPAEEAACRHFVSSITRECVTELAGYCISDLGLQEGSERELVFKRGYEKFQCVMRRAERRSEERAREKALRSSRSSHTAAADCDDTGADVPVANEERLHSEREDHERVFKARRYT